MQPNIQYAKTKDANYPEGLQYLNAIQALNDPDQQRAVLAVYSWLHYMDDVVDSTATTSEKLRSIQSLIEFFTQFDQKPSVALNDRVSHVDQHFWAELMWTWQQFPSNNHSSYFAYMDIMREISIWPKENIFRSFSDLERFNVRFFHAIVENLSPILFASVLKDGDFERYEFLKHLFQRFMLGMQVINLLMDVTEDVQCGQYWLPGVAGAETKTQKLTADLFQNYYAYGLRYMAESAPLRESEVVGSDLAEFFKRLHHIFVSLGRHIESQI